MEAWRPHGGGVGHMGAGTKAQCAAGWWEFGEGGQAGGTQVGVLQAGSDGRSREWSFGGKKWKIQGFRLA